jgi:hypothetical protein
MTRGYLTVGEGVEIVRVDNKEYPRDCSAQHAHSAWNQRALVPEQCTYVPVSPSAAHFNLRAFNSQLQEPAGVAEANTFYLFIDIS